MVENRYLINSTLDQVADDNPHLAAVRPLVLDLESTDWFRTDVEWYRKESTGNLPLFPGLTVRYRKHPRQKGWKCAPDFRVTRRSLLVQLLVQFYCAALSGAVNSHFNILKDEKRTHYLENNVAAALAEDAFIIAKWALHHYDRSPDNQEIKSLNELAKEEEDRRSRSA